MKPIKKKPNKERKAAQAGAKAGAAELAAQAGAKAGAKAFSNAASKNQPAKIESRLTKEPVGKRKRMDRRATRKQSRS